MKTVLTRAPFSSIYAISSIFLYVGQFTPESSPLRRIAVVLAIPSYIANGFFSLLLPATVVRAAPLFAFGAALLLDYLLSRTPRLKGDTS